MKQKEEVVTDEMKPQQSLEAILQLEIEIAEKIAETKDKADQKVASAQNNITDYKNRIVDDARKERDQMLKDGVAEAQKNAEEQVAAAKKDAGKFARVGEKYRDEAADLVVKLVIGAGKREEK